MSDTTVTITDADQMRDLGHRLGRLLAAGDLVMLNGPLGAGKTTLTQGIGEGLGVDGAVASPTFIVARVHPPLGDGPALFHADAYRITSADDLETLDLDTALTGSVVVVEWGSGLVEGLTDNRLDVDIARASEAVLSLGEGGVVDLTDLDGGDRTVTFTGHSDRMRRLAQAIGEQR